MKPYYKINAIKSRYFDLIRLLPRKIDAPVTMQQIEKLIEQAEEDILALETVDVIED